MKTVGTPLELAHRSNGGLHVTLLWWPERDSVSVNMLTDAGESFDIAVEDASPLEVFNHPYAYLPLAAAA
jgi:hypothetical protein